MSGCLLLLRSAGRLRLPGAWCPPPQTRPASSKPENEYDPPNPFKDPGPRRYGYRQKLFTGGVLPRPDNPNPLPLPTYRPRDIWSNKYALSGQNDYIDILGDSSIEPKDLIKGPIWLKGFKGNELQRLTRLLQYKGDKLKALYPTKHHQIKKRIYWLYKFYNLRRR